VRFEGYAGGRHLVTYSNGLTYFGFQDQVGTERVHMTQNGSSSESTFSLPFGDGQYTTGAVGLTGPTHFTGKERDSESGLDEFGARYYGSSLGRFMTPDWGGPLDEPDPVPWAEYDNPQSLNLYSYTRNNPTTFGDDDGHDCVVQTRTGDKTETVSTTSGNCDNVKVGDGQTKTYVPGTVTGISAGADGKSIDIGYTPYDQNVSAGVMNASSAPYPDRPGLAYGFNESGYRLLGTAGATMNDPRTYALWFGASATLGYGLYAAGAFEGGLTALGDLTITPTAGEQAYAERLLAQGGKKGVEKAIRTLSKRLAEHEAKVGSLKYPGTVEREIATFTRTIQALQNVLR
jgi:RHS repeat-associated protein